MKNAGLEEAQAGIKIAGRNINNLKYADDTTLMVENEEELKSLLMKVKEESEKCGLKLSIQKIMIMASSPITSRQIDEETKTLFSWAPKSLWMVTAAVKLKDPLLLERKAMTNPDSILKSRGTRDQIAISAGSWKKEESARKTSISALLTMPKPLTVWITRNCGKF